MFQHQLHANALAASVHGALEIQRHPEGIRPVRLPAWTRAQHADGGMERMASQTSGVRIRLVTAAEHIRLEATFTRTASSAHPARLLRVVAESPGAHHSLSVDEGDILLESPDRTATREQGSRSQLDFVLDSPSEDRLVTVWLPHSAASTLHTLTADAPLRPAPSEEIRWIHYGSSISHGSDLDDPRSPWPQQVARSLNLDLVNLGFAGNAMLDPFVAGAIAEASADLISLKIGINLVNGDAMRARTFVPAVHGFIDRVRGGHPEAPIALITALACPIHEHATGPTRESSPGKAGATPREIGPGDGSLTLARTRELLTSIVAIRDDPALHLIDGLDLLGTDDGHLPDNLHPDADGHTMIAARFAPLARRLVTRTG